MKQRDITNESITYIYDFNKFVTLVDVITCPYCKSNLRVRTLIKKVKSK